MASYTEKFRKDYDRSADKMGQIITDSLSQLGGKFTDAHKPEAATFGANFNKKIGGRPFNNRVTVEIRVKPHGDSQCTVMMMAYPVDPLGNKLGFGVQGKPAKLVGEALTAAWQSG